MSTKRKKRISQYLTDELKGDAKVVDEYLEQTANLNSMAFRRIKAGLPLNDDEIIEANKRVEELSIELETENKTDEK